jgi:hypothetical protein
MQCTQVPTVMPVTSIGVNGNREIWCRNLLKTQIQKPEKVSWTLLKATEYYCRKNDIEIDFKGIRYNDVSDLDRFVGSVSPFRQIIK